MSNQQITVFTGTYDSLISFLKPYVQRRAQMEGTSTIIHLYTTQVADVWVWSREVYHGDLYRALGLTYHSNIDLGDKPRPNLKLV